MGCSAGSIGVDIAAGVMRAHEHDGQRPELPRWYREKDDEGITGFTLGQGVGRMVSELLRAHLVTLSLFRDALPAADAARPALPTADAQTAADTGGGGACAGGSSRKWWRDGSTGTRHEAAPAAATYLTAALDLGMDGERTSRGARIRSR